VLLLLLLLLMMMMLGNQRPLNAGCILTLLTLLCLVVHHACHT
jgi:hypothetical protein